MVYFIQTYYFFIVSILAFLVGLSYCYAVTSRGLWPKGIVLPVVGALLMAQSIYLPIPGSDILLIESLAVCTMGGSVLGLATRMIVNARRSRRAARVV